jgi:hypothetical protein
MKKPPVAGWLLRVIGEQGDVICVISGVWRVILLDDGCLLE